ncbi:MAG: tyrosine-type recombinase/integrase [Pseudomonadota bacterium]
MSISARRIASRTVYDVRFRDVAGKLHSKTFPRRRDAEQFESELRVRKSRDEFPEMFPRRRRMTFADLSSKWLEQHSRLFKSPSSHKRDIGVVRHHLLPIFGDADVNRITTAEIQTFIVKRLEAVCEKTKRKAIPATVNREIEILRKILNDGIRWGHVKNNPCSAIRKLPEPPKRIDFLSEGEIVGLLEAATPADRSLFACAVYTGMRLGELLNLKKTHVDLERLTITVEVGSQESQTTKGRKIRHIPIGTALYPYLAEAMQSPGVYVFPSKHKSVQKRNDVRKAFHGALRRAGVERHMRFHDLRHSFASHFVMKGGDLLALKAILGHSDLQMVQRYAHLAPEHLRRGIDRLRFFARQGLAVPYQSDATPPFKDIEHGR